MSLAAALDTAGPFVPPPEATVGDTPPYMVIRRNGTVTPFDATKIAVALTKAFLAVEGNTAAASRRVHEVVEDLTRQIVEALTRRGTTGRTFHIEDIQDQAELALMRDRARSSRRSHAATGVEKSTLKRQDGKLNAVAASPIAVTEPRACAIDNPTCEACQ